MPLSLAKSDRRLFLWSGLIVLLLVAALTLLSQGEEEGSAVPSSYSAKSGGAKVAYLLLQELGYQVERWDDAPRNLPVSAEGTVLVMAQPLGAPDPDDKTALRDYLVRGGRVLITGATADLYLPQADIEVELFPLPEGREYKPRLLTSITRGGAVQMSPRAYWKKPSTAILTHYEDEGRPIVVSYKVGRGEVIWWAGSAPLSNAGIGKSGNLGLLLNSLGDAGKGHVFWDEYFHGARRSLSDYIGQTPLKYAMLQGAVVFLALLMTYSRRKGPIRPAYQPARLSPMEFVETLGNLYRRARAAGEGLEVAYARFRSIVIRRLGLRGDVPAAELAQAIHERLGYKDPGLRSLLPRVEASLGRSDLNEDEALEMVQQMGRHLDHLKLISHDQQEKIAHAERVPGAQARKD